MNLLKHLWKWPESDAVCDLHRIW